MLNPIEVAYQTGATLYAVLHNRLGTIWNTNSSTFESYNPSHWSQYAISLSEQAGSGYYYAYPPSGIGNDLVTECVYNQQGGSPSINDASIGPISIGQSQGVDVAAVEHVENAATNMQLNLSALVPGSATSGTLSSTQMTTNLSATLANVYVGRLLIFLTGVLTGQATAITGYTVSGGVLTFLAVNATPSAGDTFLIV